MVSCMTCKHRFVLTRTPCPVGCGGETWPGGVRQIPHPHKFYEPDNEQKAANVLLIAAARRNTQEGK